MELIFDFEKGICLKMLVRNEQSPGGHPYY